MLIQSIKKTAPRSVRRVVRQIRKRLFFINYAIRARGVEINPRPIFILGNQKSGTSAIAALLAKLTDLSVAIDLSKEMKVPIPMYPQVVNGRLGISEFIQCHRLEFSQDIIKEPNLTLLYPELAQQFQAAQFVFVLRDPRDNIRSLLNRLNIPGDRPDVRLFDYPTMSKAWELVINNHWFGLGGQTYIEQMAHRWNFMADIFLRHREHMLLVRYEDFLCHKLDALKSVAHQLGLDAVRDIHNQVDIQFQPRGNHTVSWHEFFGDDNLHRIETICQSRMAQLNYSVGDR